MVKQSGAGSLANNDGFSLNEVVVPEVGVLTCSFLVFRLGFTVRLAVGQDFLDPQRTDQVPRSRAGKRDPALALVLPEQRPEQKSVGRLDSLQGRGTAIGDAIAVR